MRPLPDLVKDWKLKTAFKGDVTRHLIETSGRTSSQRKVRIEQQWRRTTRLGEGSFGVVWKEVLVKGESESKERAVKVIRKRAQKSKTLDYSRELEAIVRFSYPTYNPYFVKSYGWFDSHDAVFITMEFLPHGDLEDYLSEKQTLPESEVEQIAFQVSEGLNSMHENGFAHRDLKPSNILIKELGPNWWVKIGDFGISKRAEEGGTALRTLSGTPGFLAPEILVQMLEVEGFSTEQAYTNQCDIWCLGEVIYRSLCGESPFPKSLISYVKGTAKFPLHKLEECRVSKEGIEFIENLMKAIPEERFTAAKALEHAWLAKQHPSPRSSGEFSGLDTLQSALTLSSMDPAEQAASASEWAKASAVWSTVDDISAPTNEAQQTIIKAVPVDVPVEETPFPLAEESPRDTVPPSVAEKSTSIPAEEFPQGVVVDDADDTTDDEESLSPPVDENPCDTVSPSAAEQSTSVAGIDSPQCVVVDNADDATGDENGPVDDPEAKDPSLPKLPYYSILEGLTAYENGQIVNGHGGYIGRLVEGNPKDIKAMTCIEFREKGQIEFVDKHGDVIGRAELFPLTVALINYGPLTSPRSYDPKGLEAIFSKTQYLRDDVSGAEFMKQFPLIGEGEVTKEQKATAILGHTLENTDISKEERMTRMQEMELEAQERAGAEVRARRALRVAVERQNQRNAKGIDYSPPLHPAPRSILSPDDSELENELSMDPLQSYEPIKLTDWDPNAMAAPVQQFVNSAKGTPRKIDQTVAPPKEHDAKPKSILPKDAIPIKENVPPPKGILRKPTEKFPDNPVLVTYVTTHKGHQWTKIHGSLIELGVLEEANIPYIHKSHNYLLVPRRLTGQEIQTLADHSSEYRSRISRAPNAIDDHGEQLRRYRSPLLESAISNTDTFHSPSPSSNIDSSQPIPSVYTLHPNAQIETSSMERGAELAQMPPPIAGEGNSIYRQQMNAPFFKLVTGEYPRVWAPDWNFEPLWSRTTIIKQQQSGQLIFRDESQDTIFLNSFLHHKPPLKENYFFIVYVVCPWTSTTATHPIRYIPEEPKGYRGAPGMNILHQNVKDSTHHDSKGKRRLTPAKVYNDRSTLHLDNNQGSSLVPANVYHGPGDGQERQMEIRPNRSFPSPRPDQEGHRGGHAGTGYTGYDRLPYDQERWRADPRPVREYQGSTHYDREGRVIVPSATEHQRPGYHYQTGRTVIPARSDRWRANIYHEEIQQKLKDLPEPQRPNAMKVDILQITKNPGPDGTHPKTTTSGPPPSKSAYMARRNPDIIIEQQQPKSQSSTVSKRSKIFRTSQNSKQGTISIDGSQKKSSNSAGNASAERTATKKSAPPPSGITPQNPSRMYDSTAIQRGIIDPPTSRGLVDSQLASMSQGTLPVAAPAPSSGYYIGSYNHAQEDARERHCPALPPHHASIHCSKCRYGSRSPGRSPGSTRSAYPLPGAVDAAAPPSNPYLMGGGPADADSELSRYLATRNHNIESPEGSPLIPRPESPPVRVPINPARRNYLHLPAS